MDKYKNPRIQNRKKKIKSGFKKLMSSSFKRFITSITHHTGIFFYNDRMYNRNRVQFLVDKPLYWV